MFTRPYSGALKAPSATADVAIRVIVVVYAVGDITVVAALHGRRHRADHRTCHSVRMKEVTSVVTVRTVPNFLWVSDAFISVSVPSAVSATLDDAVVFGL